MSRYSPPAKMPLFSHMTGAIPPTPPPHSPPWGAWDEKTLYSARKGKNVCPTDAFQKSISARAREEASEWPARSNRGEDHEVRAGSGKHGRGHAVQTRSKTGVCNCMKPRGTCP